MSSVKRRKIEEDIPSGHSKTNKKQELLQSASAIAATSPEPTAPTSKEVTTGDTGPEKDVPVQKTFKDLVCSSPRQTVLC